MKQISRRQMIAASAGVGGFTFLPARVLGRGRTIPPSEKLNIAFIGLGCRGAIDIKELSNQNVVAICDVDWRPIPGYRYRRACEVAPEYPQAKRYDDWRIMLQEQDKHIDAVVVATPDHVHALASITAMKMGKHVYCEKPMAHSIYEVRAMIAAEKKYKVTTQVGHQGHASADCRSIVEWVKAGAIGDVKDVRLFLPAAGRSVTYADVIKKVSEDHAVAPELKWDLWLGPAPSRPFNPMYLPNAWRRWVDFGTGTLGDYNCHFLDPAYWALDLGLPEKVEANPDPEWDPKNGQVFQNSAEVRWEFPARGGKPPVAVTWHLGANPPLPKGWGPDDVLPGGGGGILNGTKGSIMYGPIYASLPLIPSTSDYKPVTWGTPAKVRIFPKELDQEFKRPDPTLPRPASHWMEWVEAAKAGKPGGAHFGYGGMLTQIALMGNIACRQKGTVLNYDVKQGKFKNNDEANKLFRRAYREGWELPA